MNNNETRERIAAALTEIEGAGITGYVRRPKTPRARDAWPLWRGGALGTNSGYAFAQTFAVCVALGDDEYTADAFVDEWTETIINALHAAALFVDTVAPAEVPTEGGPMLALLLTGRTE